MLEKKEAKNLDAAAHVQHCGHFKSQKTNRQDKTEQFLHKIINMELIKPIKND